MERRGFIKETAKEFFTLGSICMYSCMKHDPVPYNAIDFKIDLTLPEYSKLKVPGGFVFVPQAVDILVAKTINNEFIAVAARCTHQGSLVAYYPSNIIFCSRHGAQFDLQGNVLQGPAIQPLKLFNTRLNGNILHVFG